MIRKRSGQYPDWMLKAMFKAGVKVPHKRRLCGEYDLRIARQNLDESKTNAEVNAARARCRAMMINKAHETIH